MLKKVMLIGDSIRMGYDNYVKSALEDSAEVRESDSKTTPRSIDRGVVVIF